MAAPSSSQRLVVGFRDDDPRRWALQGTIRGGEPAGRCVDCRHQVFLDRGAITAVRDRDTLLGCMFCHEQLRDRERFHQSGLIAAL